MNPLKIIFLLLIAATTTLAQNINYESLDVSFYRLPLKPQNTKSNTYSVSLEDLGANLEARQKDSLLLRALVIPGYVKVKGGGSIQLELIISPLMVTNKVAKDKPLETESNGTKKVMHQYWYDITYSFPTKLRVIVDGNLIKDQDLPGYYTTQYHPQDKTSLNSLQQAYDNDRYFIDKLKQERVDERVREIKEWLASNYGKGMFYQMINIGYIKDKKGAYDDLTKAFSLINNAFTYANKKKEYLDDNFKNHINEAVSILSTALLESSEDKKARIDHKVTAMINYNMALCHYSLNDFDKSDEYLNKIGKTTINTMEAARTLKIDLDDKRTRFVGNRLASGALAQVESAKPVEEKTIEVTPPTPKPVITTRDYVVFKPGDTVDVRFIIPSRDIMPFGDSVWLQDNIIVAEKDKRLQLQPDQVLGFSYNGIYRESLTWVKDMAVKPWTFEKKFCKRLLTGAIPVFMCYAVRTSFRDATEKYVEGTIRYYRPDNQLREFGLIGFNKWVANLVSKYPELSTKVKNGEYQKNEQNFLAIIKEYNTWAKALNN